MAPRRITRPPQMVFSGMCLPEVVAEEGADHEDIRVREVNEAQHAVDHRVAERDERVDGAERQAVEELLEEFGHCQELKVERGKLKDLIAIRFPRDRIFIRP
jgi:glutamyl-tRNA reductase